MNVPGVPEPGAMVLTWAPRPPLPTGEPTLPKVMHEVTRLPAASTRPVVSDTGLSEPQVMVTVLVACSLHTVSALRVGLAASVAIDPTVVTVAVVMLGPGSVLCAHAAPASRAVAEAARIRRFMARSPRPGERRRHPARYRPA